MSELSFYFSIFLKRSPWFLIVASMITAASVIAAYTLPPAFESRMVLLIESPQIPQELANSTVQTPAFEQLEIMQQRLLTRENMLDIARQFNVLRDMEMMSPDEIVEAMRARTSISTTSRRLREAPLMTISFEAPSARATADVLNAFLLIIQREDSEFRTGRAGETLDFFEQEVERLNGELEAESAKILEFKQANSDSLPESLEFRLSQQAMFQDRVIQIDRDIADLRNQSERLLQLYELTGNVGSGGGGNSPLSPDQELRQELQTELEEALAVFSPTNPRVKLLEARIAALDEKIAAAPRVTDVDLPETAEEMPPVLVVQLGEIETRITNLQSQKEAIEVELKGLRESIAQTPEVLIALEDLERRYDAVQDQYSQAVARLAVARTGDLIESRSRGQRLSVIEQPAIPSTPTKPNRVLIAGGGTAFGILLGIAVVFLLELLNNAVRRPEDIVSKLGITPLTTIPYIQTRRDVMRRRVFEILLIVGILLGAPALVYAVHVNVMPLDLLADRAMNKLGIRW